ncbi:hypothetical protein [Planktothrix sp. FACHB-1365]|uniref:Integron gene cassette protein n=2 Tax=Planktothrix mougeotii TaxID=54306 RepID=A0ABR9UFV8_9CYAN|nr:hypothetical protein [Planktothrix sp. FACHB-1365]MBD2485514.1 hypothetical protein [Planktothrix sp. FACHB-1365]MBE9145353.1 hypothetical protein [Planktothrix mougeotii LEGE 06226]
MKSNLNFTDTFTSESTTRCSHSGDVSLTVSGLQHIIENMNTFTGDEWLSLAPDIDQGELYRDWFIWYDAEVTQVWEAYDHLMNCWFEAEDLETLKATIDLIENSRTVVPLAA